MNTLKTLVMASILAMGTTSLVAAPAFAADKAKQTAEKKKKAPPKKDDKKDEKKDEGAKPEKAE